MSENISRCEKLQKLSRQLHGLLYSPQLGTLIGNDCLTDIASEIAEAAGIGNVSAMPALLAACKAARKELEDQTMVDAEIWPILDKAIADALGWKLTKPEAAPLDWYPGFHCIVADIHDGSSRYGCTRGIADREWRATLDGVELSTGTLEACMAACEEHKSQGN